LYQEASSHDVSIDLHTSRKSVPFGIFSSDRYQEEIKVLGMPFNFISTYGDSPEQYEQGIASLSYAMTMEGKTGFTLECGSHDDYNEADINLVINSLLNLLKFKGVIEGFEEKEVNQVTFTDEEFEKYKAPETGFVEYRKQPGQSFQRGDLLMVVLSARNLSESTKVLAGSKGTVIKISPTHIAQAGDVMMEVVTS
jgi:predicted deacylase